MVFCTHNINKFVRRYIKIKTKTKTKTFGYIKGVKKVYIFLSLHTIFIGKYVEVKLFKFYRKFFDFIIYFEYSVFKKKKIKHSFIIYCVALRDVNSLELNVTLEKEETISFVH